MKHCSINELMRSRLPLLDPIRRLGKRMRTASSLFRFYAVSKTVPIEDSFTFCVCPRANLYTVGNTIPYNVSEPTISEDLIQTNNPLTYGNIIVIFRE